MQDVDAFHLHIGVFLVSLLLLKLGQVFKRGLLVQDFEQALLHVLDGIRLCRLCAFNRLSLATDLDRGRSGAHLIGLCLDQQIINVGSTG